MQCCWSVPAFRAERALRDINDEFDRRGRCLWHSDCADEGGNRPVLIRQGVSTSCFFGIKVLPTSLQRNINLCKYLQVSAASEFHD